jgi:cyclophilin family peptidyl-prolyl cis-trans isomerase/HEAT repeat protein
VEDRREADLTLLETYANDASDEVRRRAVLAAGRIGNRLAAPMLRDALSDSMVLVAASAAFALGELGDTSAATIAAIEDLAKRVHNERDPRGIEAVAALGKLPAAAAFNALSDVLVRYVATDSLSAARRAGHTLGEALLAIWHQPQARQARVLIEPHLQSDDAEIRWRATYALMRSGEPATVPLMIDRLADSDALVRSLAARALRAPTADSAGERPAALAALVAALGDPHPHVRINALGAIATYAEPNTAGAAMALIDDSDGNVRIAAVQALASIPAPTVAVRVRALAEDASAPIGLRAAALTTLARADIEQAVQEAARWADAPSWLERLVAVRALAGGPWRATRPVLRDLAGDRDSRVARAALGAVRRAADTTSLAYALFVQTLKSADPEVRAAAINGIGQRANPVDFAALMDAYDSAQRDTAPDAALAAVDALAALAGAGVPVESAFFLRFEPHPDAAVRRRVLERFPAARAAWDRDTAQVVREVPDSVYINAVKTFVAPALAGATLPRLEIDTQHGTIVIELAADEAPLTVRNIVRLVESGFFDRAGDPLARRWHRVVPNFVLQDGDPRGDGGGGPELRIRDEINTLRYLPGALGMALSGPDTGGSQFFITHSPQPHLDGGYTVFGRVISGMAAANRVIQDDPILAMRIVRQ